jgi:hypothetical protein
MVVSLIFAGLANRDGERKKSACIQYGTFSTFLPRSRADFFADEARLRRHEVTKSVGMISLL